MNNLDSRCPNIVNVEVHFNHFMEIIFGEWKYHHTLSKKIEDYEFAEEGFSVAFHKIINNEYVDFLNQVVIHPKDFYELRQEMWDDLRDEFQTEVENKRITIWLEGEK